MPAAGLRAVVQAKSVVRRTTPCQCEWLKCVGDAERAHELYTFPIEVDYLCNREPFGPQDKGLNVGFISTRTAISRRTAKSGSRRYPMDVWIDRVAKTLAENLGAGEARSIGRRGAAMRIAVSSLAIGSAVLGRTATSSAATCCVSNEASTRICYCVGPTPAGCQWHDCLRKRRGQFCNQSVCGYTNCRLVGGYC